MTDQIIEFGCGNGRDSLFFLNLGINCIGIDMSKVAINQIRRNNKKFSKNFFALNILNENFWERINKIKGRKIFYSRFFQHTISDEVENKQIKKITSILKPGDILFFEFRLNKDKNSFKEFGTHYRRYSTATNFLKKFDHCKFLLVYKYEGRGVAKYMAEDPYVGRFIFRGI